MYDSREPTFAMILHAPRTRPQPWIARKQRASAAWIVPLIALEWVWEWAAFALSNWAFLEVLEYLGTFSILVAVIFYFSEAGDRIKLRHYQAWQVINTAQGKGGSGGRIEALQELNEDKVPLVGVDVSSAFLQGVRLEHANLLRADFSSADVRNGDLGHCNFTLANLNSANLRDANLDHAEFLDADLKDADLTGANLASADLSGAILDGADLRRADMRDVNWHQIKSIKGANILGLKNAPSGFLGWAIGQGAIPENAAIP
jgi:Pentapeptide repeats (8 copies)